MTVMIVGTLEMLYTVGSSTVSEPLAVNMVSPTDKALDLKIGLVFTNPAIDVRDTLEPYLATTYGLTNITRISIPRANALAEWTALKDGITRQIILWKIAPLSQEGLELSPAPAAPSTILALNSLQLADSTGGVHALGMDATQGLTFDGVPLGEDIAYRIRAARRWRNSTIVFGDSITIADHPKNSTTNEYYPSVGGPKAYGSHLSLLSGGVVRIDRNAGVGSDTTTGMRNRLATDVLAYKPDVCIVMGGANDVALGISLDTTISNLTYIWDTCLKNSIIPVAVTPPPSDVLARAPLLANIVTAMAFEAGKRGIPYVDVRTPFVNPLDGTVFANFMTDGVHPTEDTAATIGQAIWNGIKHLYSSAVVPPLTSMMSDPLNLVANGVFGDTDSNGIGDSWVVTPGTNVTHSIVSDPVPGGYQAMQRTAAGGQSYVSQVITSGFAPGDWLECSFLFRTESMAGGHTFSVRVDKNGNNGGIVAFPIYAVGTNRSGFCRMRFQVPSDATSLAIQLRPSTGGTGKSSVAQFTLVNLTARGIAAGA